MYEALRAKGEKALHDSLQAFAYTEIANIFSAFTFYVRAGQEGAAFDRLFSRRDDIAYVASGKGYSGQESVKKYFVESRTRLRTEKTPEGVTPGTGDYEMHWLTTPHIRVANDLKTAKGAWWAPGIVSERKSDGSLQAYVRTVNYGCDFIFEDGTWKIWHLREFQEFSYPFDGNAIDMTGREIAYGAAAELKRRQNAGAPAPDVTMKVPGPYTAARPLAMVPDILPPYDTWDDSMSCIREY